MGDFLDVRTVFFVGMINTWVCALMMIGSRRLHPASRPALLAAGLTCLTSGLAMGLLAARGILPDALTVAPPNILRVIAAVGMYLSIRLLCVLPSHGIRLALIAFVVGGAHLALGSTFENHVLRLTISSAVQFACAAAALPLLRRRRGSDAPIPLNWALVVMSLYAVTNLAHLMVFAMEGVLVDGNGIMFATSTTHILAFTVYALIPTAFALFFLGIVNGRIAGDLRRLALTDSLTGLLGRRGFYERANALMQETGERAEPMALMMIDVDHFKTINDRFGHAAGDRSLRHLAHLLEDALPAGTICGRQGGDEFCALLPGVTHAHAAQLGELFCKQVHLAEIRHDSRHVSLSVSIGVASSLQDGSRLEDLILAADRRTYLAKHRGRGQSVASDEIPSVLSQQLPLDYDSNFAPI